MSELIEVKSKLLQDYKTYHQDPEWSYETTRDSEKGKSYSLERDAFVQDLALDMAATLQLNGSSNFLYDSMQFARTELCQEKLVHYFSSESFATSQTKAGYQKAYTIFLLKDAAYLAADFLRVRNDEKMPEHTAFAMDLEEAYERSTHYTNSKLPEDDPKKTTIPFVFLKNRSVESLFDNKEEQSSNDYKCLVM